MKLSNIGERIKYLRNDLGLTQAQFGKKTSISPSHMSGIENGKENPSKAMVKLIALVFNVSEQWLLTGEGSMVQGGIVDEPREGYLKKDNLILINQVSKAVTEVFELHKGLKPEELLFCGFAGINLAMESSLSREISGYDCFEMIKSFANANTNKHTV